jgi:hypothetical protein
VLSVYFYFEGRTAAAPGTAHSHWQALYGAAVNRQASRL